MGRRRPSGGRLPPMIADVLEPLVRLATHVINAAGLPGVFGLMVAESACIPIPSEAIMLFAGFSVSQGHLTLAGIVAAGVLGNVVGSLIAWGVGYVGRVELLERNRVFHVSGSQLARADRWFGRYGPAAVFFGRMVPIVRTFISLPAGVARMPVGRFTLLTAAGSIPWVLLLAVIGREVGDRWGAWRSHLHYLDYAVLAAIVAAIAYLVIRRRRAGRALSSSPPA
jgi:membrane protein DedA with SNARE-associated domain